MPRLCPKVLLRLLCRSAPPKAAPAIPLKPRKTAQHPAALPVPRPLPRRRFVLFRVLCLVPPPRRKPAPPARVMVAPAAIRPETAQAGPRVPVVSVLVAPVALAAPVLVGPVVLAALVAPVLAAPLAALGSRQHLPRPLTPATDRAKRSVLRVAALLIFSRVILVAAATMTTAVV